jgi:hypothetical protein
VASPGRLTTPRCYFPRQPSHRLKDQSLGELQIIGRGPVIGETSVKSAHFLRAIMTPVRSGGASTVTRLRSGTETVGVTAALPALRAIAPLTLGIGPIFDAERRNGSHGDSLQ